MKDIIKKHWLAFLFAVIVGLIMVAPHIIFAIKLGHDYRGIYMMQTSDEAVYLARMQEIVDGHPSLGAVPYAEYKDRPSLMPPTATDFLLAGASILSNISLPTLLLATKFILPALLFLLIYWLILAMCTAGDSNRSSCLVPLAGALSVVLAYDSIGYLGNITDIKSTLTFLLWSRPVNPIIGALLLMCLALLLWHGRNDQRVYPKRVIAGGAIFALMVSSYFFSWGFALAFMSCWAFIQFIVGRRHPAYTTGLIAILGFIFALPYLYQTRLAATHPDFAFAAAKIGLFHSRAPVGSKVIIIVMVLLALTAFIRRMSLREDWWRFSVVLTLGGVIALNQQIITGVTIWPFHFIQYIKPFSAIILCTLLFYIVRPLLPRLFTFITVLIISGSLIFGIAIQVAAYRNSFTRYAGWQRYGELFQWLNEHASRDCVVLAQDDNDGIFMFWVPAFTHCNSAVNSNNHYILPPERIYHDFLVMLRMRGVTANGIKTYLAENRDWAIVHFYGVQTDHSLADTHSVMQAQTQDAIFTRIEREYPAFLRKDFLVELKRYQIDYVVSDGELRPDLAHALHLSSPITIVGGVAIYGVSQN